MITILASLSTFSWIPQSYNKPSPCRDVPSVDASKAPAGEACLDMIKDAQLSAVPGYWFDNIAFEAMTGCWLWIGPITVYGYGQSRKWPGTKSKRAHSALYEITIELIPAAYDADHTCRNRACVNPLHIEPVTHKENCLRGYSKHAINARKTHCKRGHPLFGPNLRLVRNGRQCKACENFHAAKYRKQRKEAIID